MRGSTTFRCRGSPDSQALPVYRASPTLRRAMPTTASVPSIFVSPEDVVWQEATNPNYTIAGNPVSVAAEFRAGANRQCTSPVLPDLSILKYQQMNDYHYSWMFTGVLTNASNQACFDGNIVVFENRPFGISTMTAADGTSTYQIDGETTVEGIFGHSGNVDAGGYATGADRTVLLRWNTNWGQPDPVVKPGDWIADITYERNQSVVLSTWWSGTPNNLPYGSNNPSITVSGTTCPHSGVSGIRCRRFSPLPLILTLAPLPVHGRLRQPVAGVQDLLLGAG